MPGSRESRENGDVGPTAIYGLAMGTALAVSATFAFALFWLALGTFLGVRLGERRLMNRIRNVPPAPPTPAHLGNTVARTPQRGSEHT
jgi:hypothetical protein